MTSSIHSLSSILIGCLTHSLMHVLKINLLKMRLTASSCKLSPKPVKHYFPKMIRTIIIIKIISFDLGQCQRYLGKKTVKPSWPAPNLLLTCTRKDWQFEIPTKQTRVITSVTWTAVTVLHQEQELPILRYLVGIRSRGVAWVSRVQRCGDWAEWESWSVVPISCTLEHFLRRLIPQ